MASKVKNMEKLSADTAHAKHPNWSCVWLAACAPHQKWEEKNDKQNNKANCLHSLRRLLFILFFVGFDFLFSLLCGSWWRFSFGRIKQLLIILILHLVNFCGDDGDHIGDPFEPDIWFTLRMKFNTRNRLIDEDCSKSYDRRLCWHPQIAININFICFGFSLILLYRNLANFHRGATE